MLNAFHNFLNDERGVVAVDYTVLSASVLAMSLATAAVLSGGIKGLVSRMDAELREQQMSDNFIGFTSAHFEPLYEHNLTTAEYAEEMFNAANAMMNQEISDALYYGINELEAGTLTQEEVVALVALASVARQRNIIDAETLDYFFGFDGSDGQLPTSF